tara:strand:- start:261 stop:602 length:342 start_codon:yes stop_codon:yes gene_type:complete
MVLPIVAAAAPIAVAGAAAVARFIVKNGFKMAIKKFGKKAAEEGAELAAKSKPLPKGVKITPRDSFSLGANNKAIQQAKPTRMPAQKTTQGPVNPKGMGFSKGGKVQRPAKIF